MNEMANRWYTVLTVVILLLSVMGPINFVYYFSFWGLLGLPLSALFVHWILAGCARCGEPLARWILHRSH
jgi:hypothetical protein